MVWNKQLLAGIFVAVGASATQLQRRSNCPSGTSNLQGIGLVGGWYDVCCPGEAVTVNGVVYCCVGNNGRNKERDLCIGDSQHCQSDEDKTSSCATAVPATAAEFSRRVSSATATLTGQAYASGTVNAPSSSSGDASSMVTAAPWAPWLAMAGGAIANAVFLV
ncbi:hypothetical protein F5Y13DRAFT_185698 [Hypoxylon sp. FL1857]|nr:hypothetical protein F5Y13DRAFT_185698 [Hypoxylon sp. FL1857]